MADWFSPSRHMRSSLSPQHLLRIASAVLVSTSLWINPALAKDPFRTSDARPISDRTEAAFKSFFQQGNYKAAANYLKQTDSNDPLALAMKASLLYFTWQGEKDEQHQGALLEQFRSYVSQTRDAAQKLLANDSLRGNLYMAVSYFLEGAYTYSKDGTVKGTPKVLDNLQQAFKSMDAAEAQSPNDPELNLLKGYMDLFIGLNLPFSSPTKAMERLDRYAAPRYLVDRGLALGYRDLGQQSKALASVDRAINLAPDNPDLLYLKAQILVKQGKNRDSIPSLEKALAKKDQLPAGLVKEISRGLDRT